MGVGNRDKRWIKMRGNEQKDWEERWRAKEENWMNEQWGRTSDDDLGMGQTGQRLRQEQ